jgi:hypothetical protein
VIALIKISEGNKENVSSIVRAKKDIAHIIDLQPVLAPIMMDIFQALRIDSNLSYAWMIENRYDIEAIMKFVDDNFYTVRVYMNDMHGRFDENINYACHIQKNS